MPKKNVRKQDDCLNCGFHFEASLKENYCPECGQKNTLGKAKVGTLLMEFLADFFLFDSKVFKSWFWLLFRPGYLTSMYNEGKRVRYISPIRLFLFSGVIFFFILSLKLKDVNWLEQLKQLQTNIGMNINYSPNLSKNGFEKLTSIPEDTLNYLPEDALLEEEEPYVIINQDTILSNSLMEMVKTMSDKEILDSLDVEDKMSKRTIKQALKIYRTQGDSYIKYAFNHFSLAILCMQPFVALILGSLYFRRKLFFVDHLIFSLHQHAFIYTCLGLLALFINSQKTLLSLIPILTILYSIYLFFSMKQVYQQGIGKTTAKMGILIITYFILLVFFTSVLYAISFYLF